VGGDEDQAEEVDRAIGRGDGGLERREDGEVAGCDEWRKCVRRVGARERENRRSPRDRDDDKHDGQDASIREAEDREREQR